MQATIQTLVGHDCYTQATAGYLFWGMATQLVLPINDLTLMPAHFLGNRSTAALAAAVTFSTHCCSDWLLLAT